MVDQIAKSFRKLTTEEIFESEKRVFFRVAHAYKQRIFRQQHRRQRKVGCFVVFLLIFAYFPSGFTQ